MSSKPGRVCVCVNAWCVTHSHYLMQTEHNSHFSACLKEPPSRAHMAAISFLVQGLPMIAGNGMGETLDMENGINLTTVQDPLIT